jgi:membrane dipeptidase
VIREMNRLGIVIDISHATDAAKSQIIAASRAPVVTSHNGLRHFAEQLGGLTDDALDALAAKGGMLGLHSAGWLIDQKSVDWDKARPRPPRRAPPPAPLVLDPEADDGRYFTELDRRMRVRWLETWGYGRPWRANQQAALDAGAPLPTVERWAEQVEWVVRRVGPRHIGLGLDLMAGGNWLRDFDATGYPRLTAALAARGLGPEVITQVLGENWLRVLDAARVDPGPEK